jgi:hypothetical protein
VRLVRVKAPAGKGEQVAEVAFGVGIAQVSVHQEHVYRLRQPIETKDVVDVETATPTAKAFLDVLMTAPFFNPEAYTIAVRQPRTVVSRETPAAVTWPLTEPTVDLFEELWQFSHVTFGFVGRVFIAASLLAYGMIEHKLLLIVAGLLFMPLLPPALAVGFGLWTRVWRLAGQGAAALVVGTVLTMAAGAMVALMAEPPLRFQESNSLVTSLLISLAVGVAAALATVDDVGRRELIGLASAAQLAILPAWFGIAFIFGVSATESASPAQRAVTFLVNVGTIVAAACGTYAFLRVRGAAVRRLMGGSGKGNE